MRHARRSIEPWVLAVLAAQLLATPSAAQHAATSAPVAGKPQGYLLPAERPDSVALVPPPPAAGSPGYQSDVAAYQALKPLQGTPRWQMAIDDANLAFPAAAGVFDCALGFAVTQQATPRLYLLLQRVVIDAGQSTAAAKNKYERDRPFEVTGDPTCVPDDEKLLRSNGSYPSGHASLGYVWAEVLAEVVPERGAALRARGYQFSQSRAVCRVHWQSDVDAGRRVGSAVLPALRRSPEFRDDLAAARAEAAAARAQSAVPAHECVAEAAALAATPVPK
jgi:acid phosphatase (class A)